MCDVQTIGGRVTHIFRSECQETLTILLPGMPLKFHVMTFGAAFPTRREAVAPVILQVSCFYRPVGIVNGKNQESSLGAVRFVTPPPSHRPSIMLDMS